MRAPCIALLATAACLDAPPGAAELDAAPGAADASALIDRRSCASILSSSPGEADGVQEIDPDGDGGQAPFEVHCDMTTQGGGWMLVARSAGANDGGDFGWLYKTGSLDDDSRPYSLQADRSGLAMTELLVGSRGAAKEWGAHVYRLELPEGFIPLFMASTAGTDPATVVGDCAPGGGPAMLQYVGHTDAVGHFYLRDNPVDLNFGLYPSGFALSGTACSTSGGLHGEQGMIFVR